MGAGRVLLDRVEELLECTRQQDLRIAKLNHEKDCVVEGCRDWKARTKILAERSERRGKMIIERNADNRALQAELDKLRQTRAAERAAPVAETRFETAPDLVVVPANVEGLAPFRKLKALHERALTELNGLRRERAERAAPAPVGLLADVRAALKAGGWEPEMGPALLDRVDAAIGAADPMPERGVGEATPFELRTRNATLARDNDTLRGRVAFMDQRVKELSEELAEANRLRKEAYKRVDGLEEQAESYRKTIAELRLTRPGFEDTSGPDRFNEEQSRIGDLNRIVEANRGGM